MPSPLRLDPFYPIVPDARWLQRIAPLGVRTVQLRWKGESRAEALREIKSALAIAEQHDIELIINDYWREAIELGASFIHLGQDDLAEADVAAIRNAGIRIGVSTHDHDELTRALAIQPDYIALGPIWETKLKPMRFGPQGLDRIAAWAGLIAPVPLVAIGGITLNRAPAVISQGARSAAVITDFMTAPEPVLRIAEWLAWSRSLPSQVPA